MNSNLKRSFRDTFGIKDKKGNRYKDIIKSFLHRQYITVEDFDIGYITVQGIDYILDCDTKVKHQLGMEGYCPCIISCQIRTNGCFAMARILKSNINEH